MVGEHVVEQATEHLTAGADACASLARTLGLGAAAGSWRLTGACVLGAGPASARLYLENGERRLCCEVHRRDGRETWFAHGACGAALDRLLDLFASRLGAGALEVLSREVSRDPASFRESLGPGRAPDDVRVPCIGQPMRLLAAGWRNFYADQDFEVLLGVPSCSASRTLNVQYTDLECFYARPQRRFSKWTFMDWPEESSSVPDPNEAADRGESPGTIVSELTERDMVMGTGERADALVAEVRRRAKPGDYLLFTHLCTPIVMGEDLTGLARRCEKELGGVSVRWSQKDRDDNDSFGQHFRALFARPGFFAGDGDPSLVNLIHFPESVRREDLAPALERLGLRVNVSVLPEVCLPDLERLPLARWQIVCERGSYPTALPKLLRAAPRSMVTVPAPYGVEGARACLAAIAAAVGREDGFDPAWEALTGELGASWEELRREAAGHRLAFVVCEATLPRLLELRYGHGAPMAPMLREMGFGLDLMYFSRHGEPPLVPAGLRGSRVSVFRTPAELARALSASEASAVYSDIVFDWRVVRAGKARFSSKDFEMGARGASRTLKRLLQACRVPFYRRYARNLAGGVRVG